MKPSPRTPNGVSRGLQKLGVDFGAYRVKVELTGPKDQCTHKEYTLAPKYHYNRDYLKAKAYTTWVYVEP